MSIARQRQARRTPGLWGSGDMEGQPRSSLVWEPVSDVAEYSA